MPCLHPISIANRAYAGQPDDYVVSQLYMKPEDTARQRLIVPCGHCPECLRAKRNDWYVRLNRELSRCNRYSLPAIFVTITIKPELYELYKESPAAGVRGLFEGLRHATGSSVKHILFQEFCPTSGRLHFHGFFYNCRLSYRQLHRIIQRYAGWAWICKASIQMSRYAVKYVTKALDDAAESGSDPVDRKYRRIFVSAGVGDYLGPLQPPSFRVSTWKFSGSGGTTYSYCIPRYYLRYLDESNRRARAALSGYLESLYLGLRETSQVCYEVLLELSNRVPGVKDSLDPAVLDKKVRTYFIRRRSMHLRSWGLDNSDLRDNTDF